MKMIRLVISVAVLAFSVINCYEEHSGLQKLDYITKVLDVQKLNGIVDNFTNTESGADKKWSKERN